MPIEELVDDALAVNRTSTYILCFFAVVALLVAGMGVYGVLAQHLLERRHEIAVRLALGAPRRHVVATMLRSWALMSGGGLALGLIGALLATRLLAALLYGVSPQDPVLLTISALLLLGAAALSAWLPLRHALHTDPMIALREE
jgi:ABC-type antimicrobial peptide transport system permease subunit